MCLLRDLIYPYIYPKKSKLLNKIHAKYKRDTIIRLSRKTIKGNSVWPHVANIPAFLME